MVLGITPVVWAAWFISERVHNRVDMGKAKSGTQLQMIQQGKVWEWSDNTMGRLADGKSVKHVLCRPHCGCPPLVPYEPPITRYIMDYNAYIYNFSMKTLFQGG
jgi:hypothetical protein